jgi:hypothetical protein
VNALILDEGNLIRVRVSQKWTLVCCCCCFIWPLYFFITFVGIRPSGYSCRLPVSSKFPLVSAIVPIEDAVLFELVRTRLFAG